MAQNYYQTLGLKNTATHDDVLTAYRRLALVTHPHRDTVMLKDRATKLKTFSQISEAFEVLSDERLRARFDNLGEEGLKRDQRSGTGGECPFYSELIGGYRFKNNALDIFQKFYLQNNPFAGLIDQSGLFTQGSLYGTAFGGQGYQGREQRKDLEVLVECSLEQFALGSPKEITFRKQKKTLDLRAIYEVETSRSIFIKPGFGPDTVLRYAGEGHEYFSHPNSDLVIRFQQSAHNTFERHGNDLFYTHSISLVDALTCEPLEVTLLDGRVLTLVSDEVICPTTVKTVTGEGMPILSDDSLALVKKGDLYIKFDIQFPKQLSKEIREEFTAWGKSLDQEGGDAE